MGMYGFKVYRCLVRRFSCSLDLGCRVLVAHVLITHGFRINGSLQRRGKWDGSKDHSSVLWGLRAMT